MSVGLMEFYDKYNQRIKLEILMLKNKINEIEKQLKVVQEYLLVHVDEISDRDIVLKEVFNTKYLQYSNRMKMQGLYFSGDNDEYIKNLFIAYARLKVRQNNLKRLLKYKNTLVLSESFHNLVIRKYYNIITGHILNGYMHNLGGNLGQIYIKEVERKFNEEGEPVRKVVDWGESKKLKNYFIKNNITPYDKWYHPEGKHWFVYYTSKYMYCWVYTNKPVFLKNLKFYRFSPTGYINCEETRSTLDYTKLVKNKEQILYNNKLGSITKLYMLLRFDPSHAIKFRRECPIQ